MNLQKYGPGLLFAASAVGTSHLVQSTRAGADYGFALAGVIVLACLLKYPAFRFGSDYAAATGRSLVDAYFAIGRWAVIVFLLELVMIMFIVTSALALVSAGLIQEVLGTQVDHRLMVAALLVVSLLLLIAGGYGVFERVSKVVVVLFLVIIVVATAAVVPDVDVERIYLMPSAAVPVGLTFLIALSGWMPTGIAMAAFQSLWVSAKRQMTPDLSQAEVRFDFNVGYWGTTVLALCFVVLGTVLMYQPGTEVANNPTQFAGQLMNLLTAGVGQMMYPLIGLAAVLVMVSSLLTVLDACPRALEAVLVDLRAGRREDASSVERGRFYTPLLLLQCIAAMVVVVFFTASFTGFLDFATGAAFITSPFLAYLSLRAMQSDEVPEEARPSKFMVALSWLGIAVLAVFSVLFVSRRLMGID